VTDSLELLVGRIEGKLDGIDEKLGRTLDELKSHDARITAVEKWQWKAAGVLALIAFIVPILVKVIL
jgi:hypothetical protein